MKVRWHGLILSFLPGLISGLIWVGDAALRPHLTGECDPKLGCAGWVQVAFAMGALSLLLSAVGIAAGSFLHRALLRKLLLRRVLALALVLTALLLLMLYTVGRWPVESLATYFVLWTAIPFAASGIALMLFRRLTSNNSFKVTPDGAPQLNR
jgi:hypothetical protein